MASFPKYENVRFFQNWKIITSTLMFNHFNVIYSLLIGGNVRIRRLPLELGACLGGDLRIRRLQPRNSELRYPRGRLPRSEKLSHKNVIKHKKGEKSGPHLDFLTTPSTPLKKIWSKPQGPLGRPPGPPWSSNYCASMFFTPSQI
jgi:hypothetical protein